MVEKGIDELNIVIIQFNELICSLMNIEYYFCEFILLGCCEIMIFLSGKIGIGKFYLMNVFIGEYFVEEGEEFDL